MSGRRLVILCGAGLSVPAPASLPAAFSLRSRIVEELASGLPSSGALTNAIAELRTSEFPLEFVLEVLVSRFGVGALGSLHPLAAGRPNRAHRSIASLAAAGHLAAVITLNFDELIENALEEIGWHEGRDFEVNIGAVQKFAVGKLPVVKLHGTLSDTGSLVATLRQVGASRHWASAFRSMFATLQHHEWLVTGYRGADFDLREGLQHVIKTFDGTWNSFCTSEIEPWVLSLLRRQGWPIVEGSTETVFDDLLIARGLPRPRASTYGPRRGAVLLSSGTSWQSTYHQDLRLKSMSDILSHIGKYALAAQLLAPHLRYSSSCDVRILLAGVETELALGRESRAAELLRRVMRRLSNDPSGLGRYRVEGEILRAKLLWQMGHGFESIRVLNQLFRAHTNGQQPLAQHQAVRVTTMLAERLAESGQPRRALRLCASAAAAAADHVQLEAVCRRTHGHVLLAAGKTRAARRELEASVIDLVADVNGKTIAYVLLGRACLAERTFAAARRALAEARRMSALMDHVPRKREIRALARHLRLADD